MDPMLNIVNNQKILLSTSGLSGKYPHVVAFQECDSILNVNSDLD